ncbi:hypothetical protein JKF63_03687 [Porcisia hertigi]|uniref:Leucine-rich repeat protein n=1 Tax=Porcisia hertigi TaxID=2761500 RepID=A0A836HIN8_9TRYP|nr:hypothetical protein JKF63_03687 [Porcisia hertigi]
MSTSTHGVMDFSFAPGKDQVLSDLPFEKAMVDELGPGEVRELNVMHAQVISLTSTPGALINDALQYVTVLRAAHNEVSNLRGIEAFRALEVLDLSHNSLRIVDAHAASLLRTLKQLRSVDFSCNNMILLDLSGVLGAPSSRLSGPGPGMSSTSSFSANGTGDAWGGSGPLSMSVADPSDGLLRLTTMDLSYNAFIDLPDLRSAPYLQVLNMGHNKLDSLVDLDTRLPLLSLRSLALHANQLPSSSALMPLCGLAATLKHIQIFRNPFTLLKNGPKAMGSSTNSGHSNLRVGGLDASMWWRPFLLWLCPLLTTVDQVEFTASERRVAGIMLFRENGLLSKSRMEYMNPQRRDDLEAYLRRTSESATPHHDAMSIIDDIEREEEEKYRVRPGDASGTGQVAPPMTHASTAQSRIAAPSLHSNNSVGGTSLSTSHGPLLAESVELPMTEAMPATQSSRGAGRMGGRSPSEARVVVIAPEEPHSTSHSTGSVLMDHIRQPTQFTSMTNLVRALQRKLRSLEEVVAVLWHADMSRRTRAAIVIQRVIRGALARMHLSEEEAESCRFIRYQLQQATTAMAAQAAHAGVAGAGGSGNGDATTGSAGQRFPSLEPVADTGSNMQEVLVSMRSLQEVMSNMWVDLEEYRAMADREQRRAAVLIQRHYRGYRARCKYGRERAVKHLSSLPRAPPLCDTGCQCASETASLRQEVSSLRSELRELRLLLDQTVHQKRVDVYSDPERVMDAIIRKHERRISVDSLAEPACLPQAHGGSPTLNATPNLTKQALEVASQKKAPGAVTLDRAHPIQKDGTAGVPGATNAQFMGSAALSPGESVMMSPAVEPTVSSDNISSTTGYASSQPTRVRKVRSRAVTMSCSDLTDKS